MGSGIGNHCLRTEPSEKEGRLGIRPKSDFWRTQDIRAGAEKRNSRQHGGTKGNIRKVKVRSKCLRMEADD